MPHPAIRSGALALITGGASGIGLATARHCSAAGMKVAIVDVDEAALAAAKTSVAGAETFAADVSSEAAWAALRKDVGARFGDEPVSLLMLNAGVGLRGGWEEPGYFHKIFDVNFFGVVHGIATFLPSVKANAGPAAVVITGSKQGITNPPGNPAYNASKAAVKSLAESLAFDLRQTENVSVHLLVPGWTFTGLTRAGGATEKPAGAWSPEQVVEFLAAKMDDRQFYIICPDNEVSEDLDRRRILWGAGDAVYGRRPLSRWQEDSKDQAKAGIEKLQIGREQ